MPNYINFPVVYLLVSILVSSALGVYVWRKTPTRGNRAFAIACAISIVWMTGDVITRISQIAAGDWIGEVLRYFGAAFLPVSLYVFIYQYCGKKIGSRRIRLLLIVPTISWLMMMTNDWHYLFFKSIVLNEIPTRVEYGVYYLFVHLPFSYAIFLTGVLTVLMEFSRASRDYRRQILLLLASLCIPFLANVLGLLKITGSYTPLSFPIFFSLTAYAIFRYQFLGGNPIAYETVFRTIRDGVLILDRHDVIRDINPAAAAGLNKRPSEVIGTHVRDAFAAWRSAIELYDAKPYELGEIEVSLFGGTRYLWINSAPIANSSGDSEGRIITIRDITDRHKHQLSLEALAFHDPLTRLANRRKFEEEVEAAIKQSSESDEPLAILFFDLNRFKNVNDTLGHEAGDELLKYVAARVASILRKPDIIARLGGDEFALLLHNCDENGVEIVIERMIENAQRPFRIGEHTLIADLSIGASFYPKDGKTLSELLRRADSEMYRAKQQGDVVTLKTLKFDSPTDLQM